VQWTKRTVQQNLTTSHWTESKNRGLDRLGAAGWIGVVGNDSAAIKLQPQKKITKSGPQAERGNMN